jgi:hypothetical protein
MGNKLNKKSKNINFKKTKLQKSYYFNKKNNDTVDEIEFKFILNDILNNHASSLANTSYLESNLEDFKRLLTTNRLNQGDLLDAYYSQLSSLTFNHAVNLNPNKIILKIVRATCFTREQEADCTKLYLKLKQNDKKMFIGINDLFISSLEAISAGTCEALLDYLKKNLAVKQYPKEINKIFTKKYLSNCNDSYITDEATTLMTLDDTSTGNEYLTTLDAFIWKYLKQLSIYLHKNDYIFANELRTNVVGVLLFIHELINSGFKMNNFYYDEHQRIDRFYNIMFLMYHNVDDLVLFKNIKQDNLDVCLNSCLKQILMVVKFAGFLKHSDAYKASFYYKLRKCAFQRWSDENRVLMYEIFMSKVCKDNFEPLSLADFCRMKIRNTCSNFSIDKLGLPRQVVEFLRYKNEIEEDVDLYFQMVY